MAKHKNTHAAADQRALAEFLAGRVASTVPSCPTYQPAIADCLAVALDDAAAGRIPDSEHATDERALDSD